MPLEEFSIICFKILSDFWRKSQKGKTRKSRQTRAPSPQRREPLPRRSPTPQRLLRCGIDNVYLDQISDFVSESLVFVHRLFRNPNK